MTLGLFMPLVLVLGALIVVPMMLAKLRALPGPTDPGYDAETVKQKKRGLQLIIFAWSTTPVLMWVVLNLIEPQEGQMVLF